MKKFLSGVLCATLVFSLTLSALAISGRMTIEVDPINVQVNGEVFQPTDVTGKEVPVFAYQGTTYAPLRALAEAYGLEVGYDKAANMATVTDPEAKPVTPTTDTIGEDSSNHSLSYEEFKAMWKLEDGIQYPWALEADYVGTLSVGELKLDWEKNAEKYESFCTQWINELCAEDEANGIMGRQMRLNYDGIERISIMKTSKGKVYVNPNFYDLSDN